MIRNNNYRRMRTKMSDNYDETVGMINYDSRVSDGSSDYVGVGEDTSVAWFVYLIIIACLVAAIR